MAGMSVHGHRLGERMGAVLTYAQSYAQSGLLIAVLDDGPCVGEAFHRQALSTFPAAAPFDWLPGRGATVQPPGVFGNSERATPRAGYALVSRIRGQQSAPGGRIVRTIGMVRARPRLACRTWPAPFGALCRWNGSPRHEGEARLQCFNRSSGQRRKP